jgi:PH (Pleckstrin Homology) domain-containing protein
LSGMLLPTESVTFASSPHPIIFVRPVVHMVVIFIVLGIVLSWQTHPVVRGHHVTVALVTGTVRLAVLVAAGLLLLREIGSLVRRLFHFLAYRIVTTNRRVFIVEGLFGRRVKPLGNTALAGATMSQGFLGRMLGYGTVNCAQGAMRDMRDPVRLYREFEAVAMGVEGDTWKQPIRQTIIP